MTSPVALIFQASSTLTAVAFDVHFIVPMPRSSASTARSCEQVVSFEQDGSPCGLTLTSAATSAESMPSSSGPNVVGASVSAAASSGLPSGAQAFTQAAANCGMTCADAACSSSGSADSPAFGLLSEQPVASRATDR